MENPTATRIAKRNAYVKAFLDAKKKLAEALNGLSAEGRTQVVEQMEQVTDTKADLANFAATQDEKLEQAVQMLLKGFVIYAVEDDTAKKTVYVSIVTTPKTRGQFNRPSPNGMEADSIRDGLSQVLLEIQNGLIPPVGGKIIQVPATGEIAFVGFGSDVIRSSDNAAMQLKMRLNAEKIAQMRAKDALVGMIIGDDTGWKGKLDETTQQTIQDFETSDSGPDASLQRFEKTRQTFLNVQKSSEQFQSVRSGISAAGRHAQNLHQQGRRRSVRGRRLHPLGEPASRANRQGNESGAIARAIPTKPAALPPRPPLRMTTYRAPAKDVAPGPTGQSAVTRTCSSYDIPHQRCRYRTRRGLDSSRHAPLPYSGCWASPVFHQCPQRAFPPRQLNAWLSETRLPPAVQNAFRARLATDPSADEWLVAQDRAGVRPRLSTAIAGHSRPNPAGSTRQG